MTRPDPLELVRQMLRAEARSGVPIPPTPDCLDDDTLAALADGTLDSTTRAAVLPHLASCRRCRHTVGSVARILADPAVRRETAWVGGGSLSRWYRLVLPLAAAAVLLLLVWPRRPEDDRLAHRAPPATANIPEPIAPIGVVAGAGALQWNAVAGADRYRVTLSDAGGRVLYEAQLTDTVATLPDSIVLATGRSYMWIVEARTGFGRWSASRLAEFQLAGGVPR